MAEHSIPYWNIALGEQEISSVTTAIRNRNVSQGKVCAELEKKLAEKLNVPYVVCTTSGTVALTLAYMALGLGPEDEIIIPNRTFVATANAAVTLGATVKAVDVLQSSPTMDISKIEAAITEKTKAVVPVHLNGRAVDMEALRSICQKHDLPIVEDSCQAFMSKFNGHYLGTFSKFGCFSLGMAKLITSGQGGFIVCHSKEDRDLLQRMKNQGVFSVADETTYNIRAGNFKFTDIQAAIAMPQLEKAEARVTHVSEIYRRYRDGLANIGFLKCIEVNLEAGEVPLRAEFLCSDRDLFIKKMAEENICVVPQVPDISSCPHLKIEGNFVNSKSYENHMITLPSGPDQPLDNVDKVISAIKSIKENFAS